MGENTGLRFLQLLDGSANIYGLGGTDLSTSYPHGIVHQYADSYSSTGLTAILIQDVSNFFDRSYFKLTYVASLMNRAEWLGAARDSEANKDNYSAFGLASATRYAGNRMSISTNVLNYANAGGTVLYYEVYVGSTWGEANDALRGVLIRWLSTDKIEMVDQWIQGPSYNKPSSNQSLFLKKVASLPDWNEFWPDPTQAGSLLREPFLLVTRPTQP
jgi:hypothetical protein